jgi:hypothetical protein
MAGTVVAFVFLGLAICFVVATNIALTKKRHREGRSMWEKTDAPWYFLKRNRSGRRSGDVRP